MSTNSRQDSERILLISLSKRFGGADVRVLQTARALHQRCPCVVATLKHSPLHQKLQEEGLTAVECGRNRASPLMLFSLVKIIRELGITLTDSHNPQSQFWGVLAAWIAAVPKRICTVHSVYGKADAGFFHQLLYRGVLLLNMALRARFIVVSPEILEHLRSLHIPGHRIRLVSNGISIPSDLPSINLREELGWSPENKLIGIFGRLTPIKGHQILFEALRMVRSQIPSVRCLVVGDGPMMADLVRCVQRLDLEEFVHFTGFCENVGSLMQICDVVCQPSFSEGLPYTVLEAAAVGKPLVLSAVGGLPDHFEHGRTARFVNPGDVETLVSEISWCINNRREAAEMGIAAKQLIADQFSLDCMLTETIAVYEENGSGKSS